MAKTTNPNVYIVSAKWMKQDRQQVKPAIWYLRQLTKAQRRALTEPGAVEQFTTSKGRTVTVASRTKVDHGAQHDVLGELVTIDKGEFAKARQPRKVSTSTNKTAAPAATTKPRTKNAAIFDRAHRAGVEAAEACQPTPMLVQQHARNFDDSSPVVQEWVRPQGVCGFAWVNVSPGTSSFARYLKAEHGGHNGPQGGIDLSATIGGQSLEINEAYARAFAATVREHGIKAYAQSRID